MDPLIAPCNYCGLPLNEAVMAGHGNYLCCSGIKNDALWSMMYINPSMVCPNSEKPQLHFEDIKKSFDAGGYDMVNICNGKRITTKYPEDVGLYCNPLDGEIRRHCNRQGEGEGGFRCAAAVGEINNKKVEAAATEITGGAMALAKVEAEDPVYTEGLFSYVNEEPETSCVSKMTNLKSSDSEEYNRPFDKRVENKEQPKVVARDHYQHELEAEEDEVRPVHKDCSGTQTPSTSNEENKFSAEANVNNDPLSRNVHLVSMTRKSSPSRDVVLKPEEANALQKIFYRLMPNSSSEAHEKKDALDNSAALNEGIIIPKKDMAAGASCVSKFGKSALDVNYREKLESRLANVENKLAHHESCLEENYRFRQAIVEEVNDLRTICGFLYNDIIQLQRAFHSEIETLQRKFSMLGNNHTQVYTEIINSLATFHEEFTRLFRTNVERIQDFEQRFEGMVGRLTEKITKLEPDDVQGVL